MKKILLFLSIFIFSFGISYGDEFDVVDTTKPEIINLNYTSYIDSNTEITLNGSNLKKCSELLFNNKSIKYKSNGENSLNFLFSDIGSYNGTIYLKCEGKTIGYTFNFPYIKSITYNPKNNLARRITIFGENFLESSVFLENGSFIIESISNNMITGTLSKDILSGNIYLNKGPYKSNLFKLDLDIPKINFINGDNGILEGEDIVIYGENLNSYNTAKVYFGDNIKSDFEILDNGNQIKVNLEGLLGTQNIYIESNGFFSNKLPIKILGNRPVITSVMEKYNPEKGNQLFIYGKNFSSNIENVKVYINDKDTKLLDVKNDYIILDTYDLSGYDNYISVISSGVNSNIYNYLNKKNLMPDVSILEVLNIENGKRNVRLTVKNFKDGDFIYLNNGVIAPEACISGVCRIKLSPEILKGEFRVGRFGLKSENYLSFDLKSKYQPYIEKIKISGGIKPGSNFEIVGKNFYDSKITSNNFLSTKNNGNFDIEVGENSIKGTILQTLDFTQNSTITIEKYGLTYSFTFSPKITEEIITTSPFIYSVKSNNYFYKPGSKVLLDGVGFNDGDIVYIGSYKTKLNLLDKSFIIPDGITKGLISVYVETSSGVKSNSFDIYISGYNDTTSNKILTEELTKNVFNLDDNGVKEIVYNFDFANSIDDIEIDSLTFDIKADNLYSDLGIFSLYYESIHLGDSLVNSDGKILFNFNLPIVKNKFNNKFSLYNKTPFIKEGDLDIKISSINGKYLNYLELPLTFIFPSNFTRTNVKSAKLNNCVDSQASKINCNSFLQGTYNLEVLKDESNENQTPIKINEPIKPVENNPTINQPIKPVENNPTINQPINIKTDYSTIIKKSKTQVVKNLIINRTDLNKTNSGKKYSTQLDILIPKMSDSKKYQLVQKIYNLKKNIESNNSTKYIEIKKLLNFMESRLELELLN